MKGACWFIKCPVWIKQFAKERAHLGSSAEQMEAAKTVVQELMQKARAD